MARTAALPDSGGVDNREFSKRGLDFRTERSAPKPEILREMENRLPDLITADRGIDVRAVGGFSPMIEPGFHPTVQLDFDGLPESRTLPKLWLGLA